MPPWCGDCHPFRYTFAHFARITFGNARELPRLRIPQSGRVFARKAAGLAAQARSDWAGLPGRGSASAAGAASLRLVAVVAEDAQVLNLMQAAWSLPAAHGDHVVTLARADQRVAAGLTPAACQQVLLKHAAERRGGRLRRLALAQRLAEELELIPFGLRHGHVPARHLAHPADAHDHRCLLVGMPLDDVPLFACSARVFRADPQASRGLRVRERNPLAGVATAAASRVHSSVALLTKPLRPVSLASTTNARAGIVHCRPDVDCPIQPSRG